MANLRNRHTGKAERSMLHLTLLVDEVEPSGHPVIAVTHAGQSPAPRLLKAESHGADPRT
jgi:hypothetical protein